jgi:hypothetical protein
MTISPPSPAPPESRLKAMNFLNRFAESLHLPGLVLQPVHQGRLPAHIKQIRDLFMQGTICISHAKTPTPG